MSSRYRTIVADPPWKVNTPNGWGEAGTSSSPKQLPYRTMTLAEIEALSVEALADTPCHLYLWTTNRWIESAYSVARAWGFVPATMLTWCKPRHGLGPGGHYVQTTEFVLFARRGTEGRNFPNRCDTTWFKWPRGAHRAKPEAFLDLVESISTPPYLEMFSRRARLGWDTWGDESLHGREALAGDAE